LNTTKDRFLCRQILGYVEKFKVIAFTHKNTDINNIGRFHIDESQLQQRLQHLKDATNLDELLYLSTCNRVEFMIVNHEEVDAVFLNKFFAAFNPNWTTAEIGWAIENAQLFENGEALRHLFSVASSIDSLVVGEREIITQVRNAYEKCNELKLTGDQIRIAIKKTIEVAKEIYTHTAIARNPVSVVSLAYRKLRELNVKQNAHFLIIGAGVTNATMAKYLNKHKFANFTVFNRTLAKAQKLAEELHGDAFLLTELPKYSKGFDVIITCTGSSEPLITPEIYKVLVGDDKSKKIVIDLAVPNDLDASILDNYNVNLIAVNNLQEIAKENLIAREREMQACYEIIEKNIEDFKKLVKARQLEIAMGAVPDKVKEISLTAKEVFAKDLQNMDDSSKEVLDKIMAYMEKKYISVPMKMAREILVGDIKK
jgi:glutamyl-tRNA reductase